MGAETLTGVHRATAILFALGAEGGARPGGVGVVELARAVGREKTQVSRTLKVLADAGLVERDPHSLGYRLGWRLFTLAAQAGDQPLLAAAPPILRDLVGAVDERAHLTVLQGSTVLTVLSERPGRAVQAAGWVGRTTPAHCTASGRALLFDHTEQEVRAVFAAADLRLGADRAPHDAAELWARVGAARARSYALADEEFEAQLVAAAAPVRDFRGHVIAAVNVSGPKFRLGEVLDPTGTHVKAAAEVLSQAIGHGPAAAPA
jgi:DNA-binding IclR family transcriptional regulator